MKVVDTLLGALIASIILFLSSMVTLFTENPELTFAVIKQATWVSLCGGAMIAFLKDYNALNARKMIASMTNGTRTGIFVVFLAMMLVSCSAPRPQIDSVADAIAVTSADIETAAETVLDLCRNASPGGQCAPNALISTSTKDDMKRQLQAALDGVKTANDALDAHDSIAADNHLDRARTLLTILSQQLARLEGD